MALAADKRTEYKDGVELAQPVDGGSVIFAGALVARNALGYLVPGSDTAGLKFQGVSRQHADNSGGADGAVRCLLRRKGLVRCKLGHAITQANQGDKVYLVDDQTVDLTANTTNDIYCGVIAEIIDSDEAWIDIEPAVAQVS